jgi:hypothetical protein
MVQSSGAGGLNCGCRHREKMNYHKKSKQRSYRDKMVFHSLQIIMRLSLYPLLPHLRLPPNPGH